MKRKNYIERRAKKQGSFCWDRRTCSACVGHIKVWTTAVKTGWASFKTLRGRFPLVTFIHHLMNKHAQKCQRFINSRDKLTSLTRGKARGVGRVIIQNVKKQTEKSNWVQDMRRKRQKQRSTTGARVTRDVNKTQVRLLRAGQTVRKAGRRQEVRHVRRFGLQVRK